MDGTLTKLSNLEVLLVSSGFAPCYTIGMLRAVTPGYQSSRQILWSLTTFFYFFYVFAALILSLVALDMGVKGRISIDATEIAVISLIPVLEALSVLQKVTMTLIASHKLGKHPDLKLTSDFHYLYHDRSSDVLHVRTRKFILFLHETPNDEVRWWKAACSAVSVVEDWKRLLLPSRNAAQGALLLIAEIASWGAGVLLHHNAALRTFASHSRVLRNALLGWPGWIYASLMNEAGLGDERGGVDEEILITAQDEAKWKGMDKGLQYGLLFFILMQKSRIFGIKRDDVIARDVNSSGKRTIVDEKTVMDAFHLRAVVQRADSTKRWLKRWGFDVDAVGGLIPATGTTQHCASV